MRVFCRFIVFFSWFAVFSTAFVSNLQTKLSKKTLKLEIFPNKILGDTFFDAFEEKQEVLFPYGKALDKINTGDDSRVFAVQERCFAGADVDVWSNDEQKYWIRGTLYHLPRTPQHIRILNARSQCLTSVKRVKEGVFDLYRGDLQQKIGWMRQKRLGFGLGDMFEVYAQSDGFFQPDNLIFTLEGDFVKHLFELRHATSHEIVAKVQKNGWIRFDAFNHYQVSVSPGMDSLFVLACAAAIDEEYEKEHKETLLHKLRP